MILKSTSEYLQNDRNQLVTSFCEAYNQKALLEKIIAFSKELSPDYVAMTVQGSLINALTKLVYQFYYFLKSNGLALTEQDKLDLAYLFEDTFQNFSVTDNLGRQYNFNDLINLEPELDLLFLEVPRFQSESGLVGFDAISDYAKIAALNELDKQDTEELINSYRQQVTARIDSDISLDASEYIELRSRLDHYCDELFNSLRAEYEDPGCCVAMITEAIDEVAFLYGNTHADILGNLDRFQQSVYVAMLPFDGLIRKHLHQFATMFDVQISSENLVPKIKETIFDEWLSMFIRKDTRISGEIDSTLFEIDQLLFPEKKKNSLN